MKGINRVFEVFLYRSTQALDHVFSLFFPKMEVLTHLTEKQALGAFDRSCR